MPRLRELAIATWIPLLAAGLNLATGSSSLAQEQPEQECDPSYPEVCIAPPEPDLDCSDINYHNFKVEGDDPHNFDGDGDGIGCENTPPQGMPDPGAPRGGTSHPNHR